MLTRVDADDAILRARVALTLGHELRDHAHKFAASGRGSSGGTLRAAVQTLRVALNSANRARAEAADPDLHEPVEAADHAALARQSITADVDDVSAAAAAAGRLGAHGYGGSGVFGAGSQLDTLDQALTAVHLDLIDARACVNHQPPPPPKSLSRSLAVCQPRTEPRKFSGRIGRDISLTAQALALAELDLAESEHRPPRCGSHKTNARSVQPRAEARFLAELGCHHAAVAVTRTRMAARRPLPARDADLVEALRLLGVAAAREADLLAIIMRWKNTPLGLADVSCAAGTAPPQPALVSRTQAAVTLQPRKWNGPPGVDHLRCFGKAAGDYPR